MTASLNPYIAGNPVGGGDAFTGRADVVHDVLCMLETPHENGLVLYGQRRIGKTSILQELEASLPQKGTYAPVYFDLQDKAALPLEQVLNELTERILHTLNMNNWEKDIDDVLTNFKKTFLPYVLSQLPEETALVLLFDEFDVLDTSGKQAGSAFFPYLRDLMSLDAKRLKFVFVIGRRPEDLSSVYLSLFKGVNSCHVSLLSQEDTVALIRLSERNNSLQWPDDLVLYVYNITGGHPFLTQQLCQEIWNNIYDTMPDNLPVVQISDIEHAIPETLKSSTNSLEWLWDGLGPAERVVASALAEAGSEIITQETLEQCLQESGVRILIGELQNAPKVLEDWDLITPDNGGYRVRVEMLRRWIVERKPLSRVRDEIDHILPVAENLFQAAYGFYQKGNFQGAIPLLHEAVGVNPNHLKANQLLAEILLVQGEFKEAIILLETLYEYNPSAACPRLIQALLTQAQKEPDDDERLALYERVIQLEPKHPEAIVEYHKLWEKRGDSAYYKNEFDLALEAYNQANAHRKIKKVTEKIQLENLYQQALGALKEKEDLKAQKLLMQVMKIEPSFQEAARYMYAAVTGADLVKRYATIRRLGYWLLIVGAFVAAFIFYNTVYKGNVIDVLAQEKNEYVTKIDDQTKKIQMLLQEQKTLEDQISPLQQTIATLMQEKKMLTEKLETRQQRIEAITQDHIALAGKVDTQQHTIETLTQEKNSLLGKTETQQQTLETLSQERSSLKGKLDAQIQTGETLQKEQQKLTEKIEKHQQTIETLTQEKSAAIGKFEAQQATIETLTQAKNTLTEQIAALQQDIETLTQEKNTLQEKDRERLQKIADLEEKQQEITKDLDSLQQAFNSLTLEKDSLRRELDEQQKTLETASETSGNLAEKLTAQKDSFEQEKQRLADTINTQQRTITALTQEKKTLEEKVSMQQQTLDTLQQSHASLAEKLETQQQTREASPEKEAQTSKKDRISALLLEAYKNYVRKIFLVPEGRNAFTICQEILALDKKNRDVRELLRQISNYYKEHGEFYFEREDYYQSAILYDNCYKVNRFLYEQGWMSKADMYACRNMKRRSDERYNEQKRGSH